MTERKPEPQRGAGKPRDDPAVPRFDESPEFPQGTTAPPPTREPQNASLSSAGPTDLDAIADVSVLRDRLRSTEQRAAQLQMLACELAHAEQRERRRFAQTLHDELQQFLVGARLKVGMLRNRLGNNAAMSLVRQVDELLKQSIQASRSLTAELSPPILYDAGLSWALDWLARQCMDKDHLEVVLDLDGETSQLDEQMSVLLFQAIRELLSNVARHAHTHAARVHLRLPGDARVEITVEDQGSGFDPSRIEAGKTGFGLFGLRERLAVFDGQITIESCPGGGTRVRITAPCKAPAAAVTPTLPMVQPPQPVADLPASHDRAVAGRAIPGRRIRLLLVDDHKIVREGLAGILADEPDMEVIGEASNGKMAVDMARRLRPDLVVMDVTMPVLNGIEATRQITSTMPGIPVIGLSAHEREDMARALIDAGGTAYLSKGGPSEDLVAIIRSSVHKAQSTPSRS
jgi:CheY-like chemotaxis protein